LSERSERNPRLLEINKIRTLKGCEYSTHPFQGAIARTILATGGTREQRARTTGYISFTPPAWKTVWHCPD
jgi:hypothetical protein